MLQLDNIVKVYSSGDTKVQALKGVSISFRKNEFVSILGHSGCGKTTLLNIVGGLDHYTSGDLIINGVSTKEYKDRDWDNYRNHSIGFVFQSYNLIPHQTVLGNVELALTLSGVKRSERKLLAQAALVRVGLADQIHKLPNQLSGGQMQRVAIARALVNNPDIILADEPTGALDTETSVQVMELLKEVAKEKLVIMVTHNPELAEQYSTRIVRLKDGEIVSDSMPFNGEELPAEGEDACDSVMESTDVANAEKEEAYVESKDAPVESGDQEKETKQKENVGKKKKPSMSFLTAFVLSIRNLFTKKGRTFLTAFAGSIGIIGIALILSLSNGFQNYIDQIEETTFSGYPFVISETSSSLGLEDLMEVFMGTGSQTDAEEYPSGRVIYSDTLASTILKKMRDSASTNDMRSFKNWVESNRSEIEGLTNAVQYRYNTQYNIYSVGTTPSGATDIVQHYPIVLSDLPDNLDMFEGMMNNNSVWQELVDNQSYLDQQYDLIAGSWPSENTGDGKVYDVVLSVDKYNRIYDYLLFMIGYLTLEEIFTNLDAKPVTYSFDDFLGKEYKILLAAQTYDKNSKGKWVEQSISSDYIKTAVQDAVTIRISGIIRPKEGVTMGSMSGVIGYRSELTKYMVNETNKLEIVKEQLADRETNILTGKPFTGAESLEFTLETLGVADLDAPSAISFYVKGFDQKEKLIKMIDKYNAQMSKTDPDKVIKYTDNVATLMASVKSIIDIISYVLIAFVSISLVVSSIMIGIITYISVLERTKEIGVLRSIGASKRDISRLFNAETLSVGFMSGAFGILVTLLLNIPINLIIKSLTGISGLAALPALGAVILVAISMFLSFIAGFIPSKIAAKKDPVVALRTE